MALGPGKHLKGLKLMGGLVTPEEVYPAVFYRVMFGDLTRKHPVRPLPRANCLSGTRPLR